MSSSRSRSARSRRPARSALVACPLADWSLAETLLAALVTSAVRPAAIEIVAGPAWNDLLASPGKPGVGWLLVGLDGSEEQVTWMTDQLHAEWLAQNANGSETIEPPRVTEIWRRLVDFSVAAAAGIAASPLVVKANLRPSAVIDFVRLALEIDGAASIQAHAGSGIVIVRFADFPPAAVSRSLIGRLQPTAVRGNRTTGGLILESSRGADSTGGLGWRHGGRGVDAQGQNSLRSGKPAEPRAFRILELNDARRQNDLRPHRQTGSHARRRRSGAAWLGHRLSSVSRLRSLRIVYVACPTYLETGKRE